jgi:hypothetical protein
MNDITIFSYALKVRQAGDCGLSALRHLTVSRSGFGLFMSVTGATLMLNLCAS